jgi:hypothetical protein
MTFREADFCTEIVTENAHIPLSQRQDHAHA